MYRPPQSHKELAGEIERIKKGEELRWDFTPSVQCSAYYYARKFKKSIKTRREGDTLIITGNGRAKKETN